MAYVIMIIKTSVQSRESKVDIQAVYESEIHSNLHDDDECMYMKNRYFNMLFLNTQCKKTQKNNNSKNMSTGCPREKLNELTLTRMFKRNKKHAMMYRRIHISSMLNDPLIAVNFYFDIRILPPKFLYTFMFAIATTFLYGVHLKFSPVARTIILYQLCYVTLLQCR